MQIILKNNSYIDFRNSNKKKLKLVFVSLAVNTTVNELRLGIFTSFNTFEKGS